jgi:hypothetical protein
MTKQKKKKETQKRECKESNGNTKIYEQFLVFWPWVSVPKNDQDKFGTRPKGSQIFPLRQTGLCRFLGLIARQTLLTLCLVPAPSLDLLWDLLT